MDDNFTFAGTIHAAPSLVAKLVATIKDCKFDMEGSWEFSIEDRKTCIDFFTDIEDYILFKGETEDENILNTILIKGLFTKLKQQNIKFGFDLFDKNRNEVKLKEWKAYQ